MTDERTTSRSLSEIGHLFLSSVRERQTNGAPMPRRQPPERVALSVPTPPRMEIAIDVDSERTDDSRLRTEAKTAQPPVVTPQSASLPEERLSFPPICAVLGAHLNDSQVARARDYARQLAQAGERIGLIEVDASIFKLTRFDPMPPGADPEFESAGLDGQRADGSLDARAMNDALEELSWDLDRWLLLLPNLRAPEARGLLRDVGHWVLLSTCDHDGVIGCYRTLKGVAEAERPRLSLALLDAPTDREADKVHRKLASVCGQFLDWPLEAETPVRSALNVAEHLVMWGQLAAREASSEGAPQWRVLANFLAKAKVPVESVEEAAALTVADEADATKPEASKAMMGLTPAPVASAPAARDEVAEPRPTLTPVAFPAVPAAPAAAPAMRWAGEDRDEAVSEVIELPDARSAGASILAAILRNESANLFECPVTAPMCPESKLAVMRDGRIVLLAAARQGLGELRSIGRAYNWLIENYNLICMAMPQLAIDRAAQPCLRLLIDHADLSAEILQPMLQSSTVTVQAYRKLRWGGKSGLLLEAA